MIKVNYNSLHEAFQDYNGVYEDELKALPGEVWVALDKHYYGVDFESSGLSELFDNLYINHLYIDNVKELDNYLSDRVTVLYADDETAYMLYE